MLRVTLNNAGAVLGPIRSWLHPDGCGSCTVLERPSPAGELRITREVRATQSVAPQIIQLLSAWHRLATRKLAPPVANAQAHPACRPTRPSMS